jgi:hypothetical protein
MHFYSYFGAKVPLFPDMTKKKSINLHKRGKKSAFSGYLAIWLLGLKTL